MSSTFSRIYGESYKNEINVTQKNGKELRPIKCLRKYGWVKLCRMHLPPGKGILGQWAKLASKAAFRKGKAFYCGYRNEISPGMWAGGIVGLKSILNAKSRAEPRLLV